ncbi:MAG: N-acetylmuramoyl-L-alanine amidase [Propionibacteriaceae bacterium]|jgi:hypothetical protein|nr:N-acetylmuramoyl-L-alanine amidase [Propionibacteriaceae bacterium]
MKNWATLTADKTILCTCAYDAGRGGNSIRFVYLHHNAGSLSTEQCRQLWDDSGRGSAHYQVEQDGTIGQTVHDWDTAWGVGDRAANQRGVSIEHANDHGAPTWTISEATLDNGAHLVAALCAFYDLGIPTWGSNVFPHSRYMATACPGAIATAQRGAYMARARQWWEQMRVDSSRGSDSPPPGVAESAHDHWLADGIIGPESVRLYQARHGLKTDGLGVTEFVTSLQEASDAPYRDGWVDGANASLALMYWPGLTAVRGADGSGSPSWRAIQMRLLGTEPDGVPGPVDAQAFQRALREGRL